MIYVVGISGGTATGRTENKIGRETQSRTAATSSQNWRAAVTLFLDGQE